MKKIICVFLCVCVFAFVFTSCKDNGEKPDNTTEITLDVTSQSTEENEITKEITLGYFKGKSLNPYKTKSDVNRNLLTLVYDSLFTIEDDFTALPLIAESFTNEGNKLTVKIRDDVTFSDGSALSASDIAYSFRIAKDNSFYKDRLSNIVSAADGEENVIFTLKRSDIYAESCLVFPIIKIGSAGENYPLGSGRYRIKRENGRLCLKANENSSHGEEMATDTIFLTSISAEESEMYLLQTGDLTYLFDDLSDSSFSKINANMVRVHLNNLVYLGFNTKREPLNDREVRVAIEQCIDKNTLIASAFGNYCTIAHNVFNPYWANNVITEKQKENRFDIGGAKDTLEKADYIYAYKHNKYRSKNFEFLELTFLVNSENEAKVKAAKLIAKELKSVGMNVTLKILPFDEYETAIKNEAFDLYLGEVRLSPNMDLSCFFGNEGKLRYGVDKSSASAKSYFDFASGTVDLSTFNEVFSYEKPLIPILYRDGMACFSRELSYEGTINQYDLFKNAYSWEVD